MCAYVWHLIMHVYVNMIGLHLNNATLSVDKIWQGKKNNKGNTWVKQLGIQHIVGTSGSFFASGLKSSNSIVASDHNKVAIFRPSGLKYSSSAQTSSEYTYIYIHIDKQYCLNRFSFSHLLNWTINLLGFYLAGMPRFYLAIG